MTDTSNPSPDTTPIRIKICGITSLQDALRAVEAGADYLGLIFVGKSPRAVDVAKAREIAQCLHGKTQLVGVFQDPAPDDVLAILNEVPLHFIQLHGNESPALLAQMPLPVIRFLPLTEPENLLTSPRLHASSVPGSAAAVQTPERNATEAPENPAKPDAPPRITAWLAEPPKGSGQSTLAWMQAHPDGAATLGQLCATVPLFLAGGLTPDNVGAVLAQCRPFAVDVASGVETAPGIKDPDKLHQFCQTVKRFYTDIPGENPLCNPSDFSALMAAFMSPNP